MSTDDNETRDEDEELADELPTSESFDPFADDGDITEDVPIKRGNTLERIRQDYDEPWKGSIREAVQNGADAFGRNRVEGMLDDDSNLLLQFEVDTDTGTYTYEDNAGGMAPQILENNLLGIDTPDEEKEAGSGAGAYGRGFYVIAMCGVGKTYVETRHGDEHVASTVTNIGKYSPPEGPTDPQLPSGTQGTYIYVQDVLEHDLEKLSDWDAVEEMLLENFSFLLYHDEVHLEYTINGTTYEPDPPDIEKYREEGQLIYREKLPQFSAEGDTYQIRDLYVIRTDVMDEDPPWTGVAMLKGNEYMNHPFMTIKSYKPQGIPSLRTPPDMIGWCDATDLCPDLENNAHTSFRGHESETGIKEILVDLHDEHFKKGRTTEEREELASDIRNSINELLAKYDDFEEYQVEDDEVETEGGEDDGDGDGEEEGEDTTGPTTPGSSLLKCQAGKREFEVGETVPLQVQIENPPGAEQERFQVYELEVASTDADFSAELPSRVVEVEANDHRTFDIQDFKPSEEGVYMFRAKIRAQPKVMDMEEDDRETLDKSQIVFYVGNIDRQRRKQEETGDGGTEGEDSTQASFVQDVAFYARGRDDSWKALASHNESGGLDLTVNASRPEWRATNRITDNDEKRDKIQHRLGTDWGLGEVILQRNIDEIHDLLEGTRVQGQDVAETIEEQLTARAKTLAEMEAEVFEDQDADYGG